MGPAVRLIEVWCLAMVACSPGDTGESHFFTVLNELEIQRADLLCTGGGAQDEESLSAERSARRHTARSWYTTPLTSRLRQLGLRPVLGVLLIDWQIILLLACCVLHTWSVLDCFDPFPPAGPDCFIITSFARLRHTKTSLEVVKYPEADLKEVSQDYHTKLPHKASLGPSDAPPILKIPMVLPDHNSSHEHRRSFYGALLDRTSGTTSI